MFKIITRFLKIFFVLFFILSYFFVKASNIQVKDIFNDIDSNYKYYNELQTLYDKGMIFPSEDGGFHPDDFLTRAEFVGIAEEVSCKKCIQPNTDITFVNKYKIPPFFDVLNKNKYFYCISDAKANNYVSGYDINYKCNDGTYKKLAKPFCINNNITREEALAVILRMGGILTAKQAEDIRQQIRNGKNFPELSKDVKPLLDDGKVYSFYPDFQKALTYKVIDTDVNGNTKTLKLIEKTGDYLYPHKNITKQEFLKMAYVALKANNSCVDLKNDSLALEMQVFDKSCNESKISSCKISNLIDPKNTFDFNSKVKGVCKKGIDSSNGYTWRFYNTNTGKQIIKKGKYLDNYKFLSPGKWLVFLTVIDNCGNTGDVKNTIYIKNDKINKDLGLKILADPVSGYGPLNVDLDGIVKGGVGPYKYSWDLGDGEKATGEKIKHIFKEFGTYQVKLKVIDKNGKEATAMVTINVSKKDINKDLGLKILADPVSGYGPLNVDLDGIVKGGVGPYKYSWDLGDGEKATGEKIKHIFKESGTYQVKLNVVDSTGKKVESYVDINVMKKEFLDISIDAKPLIGSGPLEVDLKSIVNGSNGPYEYSWDFGDNQFSNQKNVKHIFKEKGVYKVKLKVIDKDGRQGVATVLIKVTSSIDCKKDSDGDGVNDCVDKCPLIPGDTLNGGCPVFEKHCKSDCSCDDGYVCGDSNPKTCQNSVCKPKPVILSSCLNSYKQLFTGITFGNTVCNSCPCQDNRFLDFVSSLRFCDMIFPAITSLDEKKIYSRGKLFQIK